MSDLVFRTLKITAVVVISAALSLAIATIIAVVGPFLVPPVFQEVIGLLSVFLPFDAFQVFAAINIAISSIIGFMVACKLFNLNVKVVGSA